MAITGSVFILVASIFAAVAAWVFWRGAQQALKYDLNRIPGPKQVPLLGNLGSVIGSSYVHRVSLYAASGAVASVESALPPAVLPAARTRPVGGKELLMRN